MVAQIRGVSIMQILTEATDHASRAFRVYSDPKKSGEGTPL